VPLRFWRKDDDLLVQPLQLLEPDSAYSLVLVGTPTSFELRTGPVAALASRVFPLEAPGGRAVLYCGAGLTEPQAIEPQAITLEPAGVSAEIVRGVFGAPDENCFSLQAAAEPVEDLVPPPQIDGVLLEPSLLSFTGAARLSAADCTAEEQALGPGCVEVLDDRALLRAPPAETLWWLEAPQPRRLSARPGQRLTLALGLTPERSFELRGFVLDAVGTRYELVHHGRTRAPLRHVVLNEVLANPLGDEPAAEWIEIVNDSELAVDLAGLFLEDSGGAVALPPERLEPGEYALLTSALHRGFGADIASPESTRLIRLPSLGTRGLSNSGEALMLVGPEGVVSRFPAIAAPTGGVSIARRSPHDHDRDPEAFAPHAPPGASPGLPNTL
jgi:hypothetical protein